MPKELNIKFRYLRSKRLIFQVFMKKKKKSGTKIIFKLTVYTEFL